MPFRGAASSARFSKGRKSCRGDTIDSRVRLGDLLIRAKLVSEEDVAAGLERLKTHGGRLGDNLAAIGAISQATLDGFLHCIPREPKDIAATGIEETELLALLMKVI